MSEPSYSRHSLPWFHTKRGRDVWLVALATRSLINSMDDDPDECVGITIFDLRIVLVDAGISRPDQDETVLHELMHVSGHGRGLKASAEETAVRAISPPLFALLYGMGLRWPRRPRGACAFERWARTFHEEE